MAWTIIESGSREEMVTLRGGQIQDIFWKSMGFMIDVMCEIKMRN